MRQPQQVIFSWLPRNTSSPASAGETQYEFSLYEIRPEGRNPNDVVLSSQPVFKTTIDYTQLVYGPAEPQLIENMRYAWRVRAIDTQGRDAFRNNGYSEVCTFTYGGVDPAFIVGGIAGLQAEGESERSARIWWEKGDFDSYRIYYKKSGQGHEWFTSDLLAKDMDPAKEEGELKLFDLEPDTEYETRAQAKKMGTPGPYTDIIKFRTLPVRVAHCGDPALLPERGPGEPFREAIKGMAIEVDGMEMTLLDVAHLGDGYYQGLGRVSVDYLGGASFTASFDRIFINTDRQVVLGRIDFVTNGVAVMAEEQLAAQKDREKERKKEENRQEWAGTDFYGKIFLFDNIVIEDVSVNGPNINITDNEGNIHPNTEVAAILAANPEKAIIIEDKNGDQWVVEKDGDGAKVTKVEGGGLGAGANGTNNTLTFSIEEQIVISVLESFKKDIEAWLSVNGKGPLTVSETSNLEKLPSCLPEDEEFVKKIYSHVTELLDDKPTQIRPLVDKIKKRSTVLDDIAQNISTDVGDWKGAVGVDEWQLASDETCKQLLSESGIVNSLLVVTLEDCPDCNLWQMPNGQLFYASRTDYALSIEGDALFDKLDVVYYIISNGNKYLWNFYLEAYYNEEGERFVNESSSWYDGIVLGLGEVGQEMIDPQTYTDIAVNSLRMSFAIAMGGDMAKDMGLGLGPKEYRQLFDQMQGWEGEDWSKFFVKTTWGVGSSYVGSFLLNSTKARLFRVKEYMDADIEIRINKNGTKAFTLAGDEIGDVLEDGLIKGKLSGRSFNPSKAGGPIKKLEWKSVAIDVAGLDKIKKHLTRFGASSQNSKAIKRLQDIIDGKIEVTDYDRRFYTHELREYERYGNLGIEDGINDPDVWNNAHTATLEEYNINEAKTPVYHPDTEPSIDDLLKEY